MREISVTEFVRNFAELINRVSYLNERFVLVRGNRRLAEVRPLPKAERLADLPALLSDVPRLGAAAAHEFETDIERARGGLPPQHDPWDF